MINAAMITTRAMSPSFPSTDLPRSAGRTSSKVKSWSNSSFTRLNSWSVKLVPSQSDTSKPLSGCNQNDFLELSTKTTRDRSSRSLVKSLAKGRPNGIHSSRYSAGKSSNPSKATLWLAYCWVPAVYTAMSMSFWLFSHETKSLAPGRSETNNGTSSSNPKTSPFPLASKSISAGCQSRGDFFSQLQVASFTSEACSSVSSRSKTTSSRSLNRLAPGLLKFKLKVLKATRASSRCHFRMAFFYATRRQKIFSSSKIRSMCCVD